MPRRDDLIGLLRSLDGALKTVEPAPGHEARLRARLAEASGERAPARRIARPLALALCALAAGGATWLAWSRSRAPEPSAQPAGAPQASGVIFAPPRPEPPASAPPPRPSPRRAPPVLPLLPPHGELAPSPAPRQDDVAPAPVDIAPPRAERGVEPAFKAQVTTAREDDKRAASKGNSAPRQLGWIAPGAAPAAQGPGSPGLPALGTLSGDARSPASSAGSGRGAPYGAGDPGTKLPVSTAPPGAPSCESEALDFGGKCVDAADFKEISSGHCDGKGLVLAGLDVAVGCGAGGVAVGKVTCCSPGSSSEPADPYAACKWLEAGDGVTCVDAAILEKELAATCVSWSMTFAKAEVVVPCSGGEAALSKGICCPPEAPAGDTGPSPSGLVGDGLACTPDEKLEDVASATCLSLGLVLLDFWPAEDCDADTSTAAKYMCGE